MKNTVVKWILLLFILCCGVFTALPGSRFSMGPYKQSMEHLKNNHPEIKKVLHITEVTAGPLLDHNKIGHWQHYWINNQYAIEYTNLSVFTDLHKKATLDEFLTPGEIFCMADVKNSPLNRENFDLVLSKSRLIRLDEILDQKSKGSMILLLYILEY